MEKLEFSIHIAAGPQKVWDIMLTADTYKEWVNVCWPGSYYEGNWQKGENLRFLSSGGGGTLATIMDNRPPEYTLAKHIAIIRKDGTEDRESETAKTWIGSTEAYIFRKKNGGTELRIEVNTSAEWAKMFEDDWPRALLSLKKICES